MKQYHLIIERTTVISRYVWAKDESHAHELSALDSGDCREFVGLVRETIIKTELVNEEG